VYLRFQAQPIEARGTGAAADRVHSGALARANTTLARAANASARADLQLFGYKLCHPGEPVRVHER
jgi:hypothetical protein